jgi:hypothetical protein
VVGAVNAILATLAVRVLRDRPELWQRRSVLLAAVTWALVSPAAARHRLASSRSLVAVGTGAAAAQRRRRDRRDAHHAQPDASGARPRGCRRRTTG